MGYTTGTDPLVLEKRRRARLLVPVGMAGEYPPLPILREFQGQIGTDSYSIEFYNLIKCETISPWHDIPLIPPFKPDNKENVYRFVCEMPKGTNEKMEIMTKKPYNPIQQDYNKKDFSLRYITHGRLKYNYGALPQTWEDPSMHDEVENYKIDLPGDNDPVDFIEIGERRAKRGEVMHVKILGALGLVDEGELDWKIIGIDVFDEQAQFLHDIGDVGNQLPGVIEEIREWYRVYKVCEGKEPNSYVADGKAFCSETAREIVHKTHENWKILKSQHDFNPALNRGFWISDSDGKISLDLK